MAPFVQIIFDVEADLIHGWSGLFFHAGYATHIFLFRKDRMLIECVA